jgi:hypothetical protein
MKGKSIAVQILTTIILIVGSVGSLFNETWVAVLGVVAAAATLIVKTFFPSGTLVFGWDILLWATNIGYVILQITNMVGTVAWIDPTIINAMAVVINTVILVIANGQNGVLASK